MIMNNRKTIKSKTINRLITIFEIVLAVIFVISVFHFQTQLTKSRYSVTMTSKLQDVMAVMTENRKVNESARASFDIMQKCYIEAANYELSLCPSSSWTEKTLENIRSLLDAQALFLIDGKGQIILSTNWDSSEDFTDFLYNTLRDVTEENPCSSIVWLNPENSSSEYPCYISYLIEPDRILVIKNDWYILRDIQNMNASGRSIVAKSAVGLNGFIFIVTEGGRLSSYPSTNDKKPETLEDIGLSKDCLEDGYQGVLELEGHSYYCVIEYYKEGACYLICAVPLSEIRIEVLWTAGGVILIVLFLIMLMHRYFHLLTVEDEGKKSGRKYFRTPVRRIAFLLLLCLIATITASVYLDCLFLYSMRARSNAYEADNLNRILSDDFVFSHSDEAFYQQYIENITFLAADIVSKLPAEPGSQELADLCEILGVDHLLIYDKHGKVIASDKHYTGLRLSNDPEDMSYEFRWLLYGEPIVLQDKEDDSYLKEPYLFSGAPIIREDGEYDGFVQLAQAPGLRTFMTEASSIGSLLCMYSGKEGDTYSFVIDKETGLVTSSYEKMNGKTAESLGLTEIEMTDGFAGFFRLKNGRRSLGTCREGETYYVFVAVDTSHTLLDSIKSTVRTIVPGLVAELLFALILLFCLHFFAKEAGTEVQTDRQQQSRDVKGAEESLLHLLHRTMFVISGVFTFVMVFRNILFPEGSLFYYVFNFRWARGLHIFSITRSILWVVVLIFLAIVIRSLMSILGTLLPSRQETIVRLLSSLVKYATMIGSIYLCALLLGAPSNFLLAFSGVATVIISLGAQNLVSDIMSGLFIIFEGTFRVGDMITVDSWHGQVIEVGLRNTKIRDLIENDIKIMNNSIIKSVINYSEIPSWSPVTISFDYREDIAKLEEVFEKEKETIRKHIPQMIGDPVYMGVDSLSESCLVLRFQGLCRNQDQLKVQRSLNRELKLMFDRNGFSIPFPQLTISGREAEDGSLLPDPEKSEP